MSRSNPTYAGVSNGQPCRRNQQAKSPKTKSHGRFPGLRRSQIKAPFRKSDGQIGRRTPIRLEMCRGENLGVRVDQLGNRKKERIDRRSRCFYAKPAVHPTMWNCDNGAASASKLRMKMDYLTRRMCVSTSFSRDPLEQNGRLVPILGSEPLQRAETRGIQQKCRGNDNPEQIKNSSKIHAPGSHGL
jgi:hypothetical protein